MAKKKKVSVKSTRKKITHTGVNHLQYFYVLIAVLGIVSFSAGFYHASNKQEVLGAEHRNEDLPRDSEDRPEPRERRDQAERSQMRLREKDDMNRPPREETRKDSSESGKEREKKARDPRIIVLPEQAVQTLLEKGKITQASSPSAISTSSAVYTFIKGKPVYIIQGTDDKKFLGVLPVKVKKNIVISAENGEIEETKMSPVDMLLNFFSFK